MEGYGHLQKQEKYKRRAISAGHCPVVKTGFKETTVSGTIVCYHVNFPRLNAYDVILLHLCYGNSFARRALDR